LTGRGSDDGARRGNAIPALGLSTGGLPHFDAHDLVLMSLEIGMRHVETSPTYDNESAVGGALAGSGVDRSELFVSSTIGCHDGDRERLFDSFDVTLDLLGLRSIDLLLLRVDGTPPQRTAACEALDGLQQEGVVSRLGLALGDASDLDHLSPLAPFDVVAMTSHPLRSQRAVRQWCAERGWEFLTMSPFGRDIEAGEVLGNTVITDLARDHGASAQQVALAWAVARPQSAVVVRSESPDDLFDQWESRRVELSPEDVLAVDELDTDAD
jgi:diketogulonate reductase-like aldo/keto reductase